MKTVLRLVSRLDVSNVDGWFAEHRSQILKLVQKGYDANRVLASLYLRSHAKANQAQTAVYLASMRSDVVWRSIESMGPIEFKQLIKKGIDPSTATALMLDRLYGALFRHTMNGSRQTVARTVERSSSIRGWRRVSTGSPCFFCAVLISRGAVYSKESVRFQAHDHDKCVPEPLYRREEEPEQTKRLQALWKESTEGLSGAAALRAFRSALKNNPGG